MPSKLTKRFVEVLGPKEKPYERRDTEVTGFLVRVETTGHKSFWLVYSHNGKRMIRYRLGIYGNVSVEGARRLALAAAGEVAKGIDPQARRKADRKLAGRERLIKLSTFLDHKFEPWFKTEFKTASIQLARIRADFADFLERPMTDLHQIAVEGLRQKWRKEGKQPATINRDLQRIGSVLSRAVRWGVLAEHPLRPRGAEPLKPLRHDKTGRVRFLSSAEENALREALATREDRLRAERMRYNTWRIARHMDPLPERKGNLIDHLKPLTLSALNTGMRRGELFSLKWSDVDLNARVVTVRAATAKSGQTRRIPLNREAVDVLSAWRGRQADKTALVFPGENGKRLDNINKSWRGTVKSARLEGFNFHDLRHTFASRLVQAGVDLNTVRTLLGHSEISTTMIYSHLSPDNLRVAVEKVVAA